MPDEDFPPTCLSDLPHGPTTVRDLLQHYFGCIEINQRDTFLSRKENNRFWDEQVEIERLRCLETTDAKVDRSDPTTEQTQAEDKVKKSIVELAIAVDAQYERTQVLRTALSQASPDSNLVLFVEQSRRAWRESQRYRDGIKEVRTWRRLKGLYTDSAETVERIESDPEHGRQHVRSIIVDFRGLDALKNGTSAYDLEEDVNAYLIQYTRIPDRSGGGGSVDGSGRADDSKFAHLPARSMDERLLDDRFQGMFPNQHVSMKTLLGAVESTSNILSRRLCDMTDPTRLRYIHLPTNNMQVRAFASPILRVGSLD